MVSPATPATLGRYVKDKTLLWRVRQAIVTYTSLIPYIAFSLFPFYIMLITSLKSRQEINNLGKSPFWATGMWNEFLYSLVFIQDELQKTLSVGVVTELIRGDIYFWGSLMAACLTGSIPILILYAFFMDYFVSGLTAGAIK